jgi:hypothetical protein
MYYEFCNSSFDRVELMPAEDGQLSETCKKAINIYEYKLNHTGPC